MAQVRRAGRSLKRSWQNETLAGAKDNAVVKTSILTTAGAECATELLNSRTLASHRRQRLCASLSFETAVILVDHMQALS